jgi:phage terminase large subunit
MRLKFQTRGNSKQLECVNAWIDPTARDILYGGAKGGAKSFTGCKLIFHDALVYPETHYFIARRKLNDLIKYTQPSINECFQDWGIKLTDYTKFNGQYNYYECVKTGSKVFLIEAAFLPSDEKYERFGSMQMTRGWIEEAGEVDEGAKNNLHASVGRWKNDIWNIPGKILLTCNPSKNFLYREYYKKWKTGTLEPWKRFIQALPQDNKSLTKDYIEHLERTLNKNEKERLLKGNWEYDDDPSSLLDYEKITDIFTNTHVPQGRKCITADIARLGGDRIVIILWNGMRGKVLSATKQRLTVTTTEVEAARVRHGVGKSDVLVDSDGLGSGVEDFGGYKGFVNNSRPLPDPRKPVGADGKKVVENFDMLKSQCGFRMAEIINASGLYLECEDWMKPLIIEDLEQWKQKELDSDMKKGMMSKKDIKEAIGRSPDFGDAILMRAWFELRPSIRPIVDSLDEEPVTLYQ